MGLFHSGIGRQSAVLFAHEGASVVVTDSNTAAAARTAGAITEFGGKAIAVGGNIADPKDVQCIIKTAVVSHILLEEQLVGASIYKNLHILVADHTGRIWRVEYFVQ